MPDYRELAIEYAHQNKSLFVSKLKDLVKIPSISTDPEHEHDMVKAATFLAHCLEDLGAKKVKIYPTQLHPIVFGEIKSNPANKTILVYGHYDVQPPEPLDLWQSPPFKPEQKGDKLAGRGVSDMKGQVIACLAAIESILKSGSLAVNLKFIFEGEEEIGSPNLDKFIIDHKDLLAGDFVLNPDSSMIAPEIPTIVYALRGLAYFEMRVYGPAHDLHSGTFGGLLYNPAQALAVLIAGMHDSQGRITLPGFYDKVKPLNSEERDELARLPMDEDYYQKQSGADALWGETGFTPTERVGARPTLDVNGLFSGFTGKGSKTVIPAWAMAKISMRLVQDQDPQDVQPQLIKYLEQYPFPGIRWEITPLSGGPACLTDPSSPATQALAHALETVWHRKPVYKREGGSIPVVASMQKILGIDSVLTGFGLPDDNIHAPNEHLDLPTWFKGIDAIIHFFYNV